MAQFDAINLNEFWVFLVHILVGRLIWLHLHFIHNNSLIDKIGALWTNDTHENHKASPFFAAAITNQTRSYGWLRLHHVACSCFWLCTCVCGILWLDIDCCSGVVTSDFNSKPNWSAVLKSRLGHLSSDQYGWYLWDSSGIHKIKREKRFPLTPFCPSPL